MKFRYIHNLSINIFGKRFDVLSKQQTSMAALQDHPSLKIELAIYVNMINILLDLVLR